MFCSKCGTNLADDSQFCRKCGHPAAGSGGMSVTGSGAAAAPALAKITPEQKSPVKILSGVVLVVLLLTLAVVHVQQNRRPNAPPPTMGKLYSITVPHSETITNSAFSVAANSSKYVRFQIRPEATEIELDGHFSATGGMGNDVEVYVLDEDGFVNSQNGHPAATYYNSGKVTQANITATLPGPGTYYLFFNNKFSLMTPKAVVANATVQYNTMERR